MAGLFEGEGHCRGNGTEQAVISMSDREPIQKLQDFLGGSVLVKEYPDHGWKTQYRWGICGARARGFLMTIYRLVSPRRQEQIRKALASGPQFHASRGKPVVNGHGSCTGERQMTLAAQP
jgi:hypothetical protein